jgi:hypothetical protein
VLGTISYTTFAEPPSGGLYLRPVLFQWQHVSCSKREISPLSHTVTLYRVLCADIHFRDQNKVRPRGDTQGKAMKAQRYAARKTATLGLTAFVLLAGCAAQPQNAEEFRKFVPGVLMGKVETFEASRPYREVARTFQAKAPECLNVSVRRVSQTGTVMQNVLNVYKPTVHVTNKRAELHVQRHSEGPALTMVGQEPAGGFYVFVADATPIGNNKTRIDIYGTSIGVDALFRAVKGWATGKNLGCPDMTKN